MAPMFRPPTGSPSASRSVRTSDQQPRPAAGPGVVAPVSALCCRAGTSRGSGDGTVRPRSLQRTETAMSNTEQTDKAESMDDDADRTEYIGLRVTPAEKRAIESAAEQSGRTMSAHLRKSATGELPSPTIHVPDSRLDAAADLAPIANNLNQIARRANAIRRIVIENGFGGTDATSVYESAAGAAEKAYQEIQSLRRDLVGSEPLLTAADILERYERAENIGALEIDADKVGRTAEMLRRWADKFGEGE